MMCHYRSIGMMYSEHYLSCCYYCCVLGRGWCFPAHSDFRSELTYSLHWVFAHGCEASSLEFPFLVDGQACALTEGENATNEIKGRQHC